MRRPAPDVPGFTLPADLRELIQRAGYYPALVADVTAAALGGDAVRAHLVHQETTFDQESVRRHLTVLVLTEHKLVIVHADDHDDHHERAVATATSETIPVSAVRGVMLTHVVPDPHAYQPGSLGSELTLTIGWGTVSRLDVMSATCGDPSCDADHGYEGTIASDDISLRISAAADGEHALRRATSFAQALSAGIGRR